MKTLSGILGTLCLLWLAAPCSAQDTPNSKIKMLKFDASQIPANITYPGDIVEGKRWMDENGENFLLLTRTKNKVEEMEGVPYTTAFLFGNHYAKIEGGSTFRLLRKVSDFVRECDLEVMKVGYIPNSVSITDLNNNGKAEATFLYQVICSSEATGPQPVKLMMLEDGERFPIRGTTSLVLTAREGSNLTRQVVKPGEQQIGGEFEEAPDAFLEYAKTQWSKFAVTDK